MIISPSTYEALSLETFLAFDIETTGLDSDKDEILEVGMVRVKEGNVCERYSQLFHPSVPIPRAVTQLTGISAEDCADKPSLEEKFSEIVDFLGNDWLLTHNANFDLSFLRRVWEQFMPDLSPVSSERILDTLELSRLLLHWLPNHRLETVTEFLNVSTQPEHRALADAEATALVFLEMLFLVLSLNVRTIQLVNRILDGASDGLRFFFKKVETFIRKYGSEQKFRSRKGPQNILGKAVKRSEKAERHKLQEEEIDCFFQSNGFLSKVLPQYESRKPQQEMARMVSTSFNQEEFLAAEAGTGVGKSLAYLIPTILWTARNNSFGAVVSTHTKTLQDQLFFKEIPMLRQIIDEPFKAVLLKGRANYLCLRRCENMLQHMDERLSLKQRRELLPLGSWMFETQTGDIDENPGFRRELNGDIWSQLNCEERGCRAFQCEYESDCFLEKVRRASRTAHIVVVNHSLLFSDLVSGHSVLGDYDTLIVDEAHQIERVASQYVGKLYHIWLFQNVSNRLYQQVPEEVGMLISVQNIVRKTRLGKAKSAELERTIDILKKLSKKLWQDALRFFQGVGGIVSFKLSHQHFQRKLRFRGGRELFGLIPEETDALKESLDNLDSVLSNFLSILAENESLVSTIDEEAGRELEAVLDQVVNLRELLIHFCRDDYGDDVVWCEVNQRQEESEVRLYSVPVDIASLLAETLYPRLKRCVLTSATLTVGESFDYILGRWGLDRVEKERVITRIFGSPFDFPEQAILLVPTFMSSPKDKYFSHDVSNLLERILSIHSKGTMILFTSHAMLREVYHLIRPSLEEKGIRILGQGLDGTRTSLLKIFKEDEKSVLLGTNSFWEGVDVPGSALELLVITKIPFDVPTEPLVQARMEQVKTETGNGFLNYSVPEAIVRFRQGFGRLIRSGEDRGGILLLDRRVVHTEYGTLFLESLPVEAKVCEGEETMMKVLEEWFS